VAKFRTFSVPGPLASRREVGKERQREGERGRASMTQNSLIFAADTVVSSLNSLEAINYTGVHGHSSFLSLSQSPTAPLVIAVPPCRPVQQPRLNPSTQAPTGIPRYRGFTKVNLLALRCRRKPRSRDT